MDPSMLVLIIAVIKYYKSNILWDISHVKKNPKMKTKESKSKEKKSRYT